LKRFLTERHGPESKNFKPNPVEQQPKLPFKVAVIGAGPVGLSAAHDLALMGYPVTIFEAAAVPGGMLYLGIPEYRLPRDVVEAQVREILETGDVTLKLNQRAGKDFSIEDLRSQGFAAVLIAVGAHRSRDLSIPGVDLDGVYKGIDFLLNVNLGYKFTIGKKVVVIGGGNVAMDVARSAAREVVRQHEMQTEDWAKNLTAVASHEMVDISLSALRMGASEVHIVCIERRNEMPAALEEIEEAETEGVIIHAGVGPNKVLGQDGRVTALETVRTSRVFDEQGRFSPQFQSGSESQIDCDTVILAIGQSPNLDFLGSSSKIEVTPRGLIAVDRDSLMTSVPGIFAGGDCVFGPRLIIDSVADGKRAAVGIDEFLRGQQHADPLLEIEVLDRHQMITNYMEIARQSVPMLPLERRTGMTEVEIGFDEQTAVQEAQRCLHCWINTVFEGTEVDGTECVLCGGCVDVCPEQCLELVPLQEIEFPEPVLALLESNKSAYEVELRGVAVQELAEKQVAGAVMVKDETRCIRCGLCALRCPVNEITMEAFHFRSAEATGLIPIQSFDLRSK
jgi:NADPH-dependent glutamate synthase beta subunit-like oxidoreductase